MMLSLSSLTPVLAMERTARHTPLTVSTRHFIPPLARSLTLRRNLASDGNRFSRTAMHGSKDDLEKQLDMTQNTLDRVLAAVQAAQAGQQQAASAHMPQDNTLAAREQLLWDRQQAMFDRLQQQMDQERQAWNERERLLLSELSALRQELLRLLTTQRHGGVAAAAAAPELSQYAGSNSFGTSASSASVQAKISGPSPASAAVADAIRAVRDQHINPPVSSTTASSTPNDSDVDQLGPVSSWQDLFPGASQGPSDTHAADTVAAAVSAVDTTDVLADMDLSYGSSRGRRRVSVGSNNSIHADAGGSSSDDEAGTVTSSSSSSNAAALAVVADDDAAAAAGQVEKQKGDPSGPPPVLSVGDDDIFWVAKLHDGLVNAGFYPSDDELENWLFSDGTLTALLTFQACNDLPETGVTCEATWRKLIGHEEFEAAYGHLIGGSSSSSENGTAVVEAEQEVITFSFPSPTFNANSSSSSGAVSSSSGKVSKSGWPVLMDMDGGREVHALQVCLSKAGFNCGEDEMRWWQFGSSTLDALKTFQACNDLPESGVCDERTWLALLGPDAKPEELEEIRGDESMYEDDMSASHEGAVWLLGEQRWSKPVN